jgi:phosphatidate cytidylyltransferase
LVLDLAEHQSSRWADLGLRALSAAVLTPVAVACVWIGGIAFTAIVAVMMIGLLVEWLMLCRHPPRLDPLHGSSPRGDGETLRIPPPLGLFSAGLLYVAVSGVALLWLRADPVAGRADVLFLLLIVWAGDIGAYTVGRWVGGPRLAPRISPGKTWSGAIGGLVTAVVVGLIAAHFLWQTTTVWPAAAIASVLSVVAQAGDLLESFVKRRLAVKDSGHLIPGHGGLFDRLDGVLAAAPAAALLALVVGRGVVLWQ